MKKETFYIIYQVVKNEEGEIVDIRNCYDNTNREKVAEWLNIGTNNIVNYTAKDIDNINCRLKEEKYFIFKDYE